MDCGVTGWKREEKFRPNSERRGVWPQRSGSQEVVRLSLSTFPALCSASSAPPRFVFLFSRLGGAVASRRHGRRERQAPAWRVCGFSPTWGSAFRAEASAPTAFSAVRLGGAVANRRHGRRERQAPAWRVCGFSPSWGSAFPGGGLCSHCVLRSSAGRGGCKPPPRFRAGLQPCYGVTTETLRRAKSRPVAVRPGGRATVTLVKPGASGASLMVMSLAPVP